jgi:uncharacterized protein YkwD
MKKFWVVIGIFLIIGGLGWYCRAELFNFYLHLTQNLPGVESVSPEKLINKLEQSISAPPPLQNTQEAPQSVLTKAGVIKLTNLQRANNGSLPALKENAKLDAAALAKAQDMFKNQYFEHVSPAGIGPSDLAKQMDYVYIAYGENLALGNFKDDQALMQGWMNSPGHRANILNPKYQEIGVAVLKGTYQGLVTWMAVQEFGLPLSACPQPDANLKNQIDQGNSQIKILKQTIEDQRAEITTTQYPSRNDYNQAVTQYNDLVHQYNALVVQNKTLVNSYNLQVDQFNACAGG